MYHQPEDKDPQEQGGYLSQRRQDEVFNKEEHGHVACMISTSIEAVKNGTRYRKGF